MRTTLTIDDQLSREVLKLTHAKTLADGLREAIKGYVRQRQLMGLSALAGKIKFEEGYDYKALRGKESA